MQFFLAPFLAVTYLRKNRSLWKFVAVPIGITFAVYLLSYHFILGWIRDVFHDFFGTAGWVFLLYILVTIGLLLVSFYAFVLFLNIIGAPFNELLSEKVEEQSHRPANKEQVTRSWRSLFREYGRTIAAEITRLFVFGGLSLILVLLSFTFSGGVFLPALGGILAVFFLVFEFMDYPMARHALTFHQKLRLLWRHRTAYLLYGLGLMAFFAIPLLNVLFVPVAVISATQLFLQTKGK